MVDRALGDMRFLDRVQRAFEPEDMTQNRLEEWILHSKGKHLVSKGADKGYREVSPSGLKSPSIKLARELSSIEKIYSDIQKAELIDISNIKERIDGAYVHKDKLNQEVESRVGSIVEKDLLGTSSKEILGKEISKSEYQNLWRTDRSSATKIAIRITKLR